MIYLLSDHHTEQGLRKGRPNQEGMAGMFHAFCVLFCTTYTMSSPMFSTMIVNGR